MRELRNGFNLVSAMSLETALPEDEHEAGLRGRRFEALRAAEQISCNPTSVVFLEEQVGRQKAVNEAQADFNRALDNGESTAKPSAMRKNAPPQSRLRYNRPFRD